MAAVLSCGPAASISHLTAAALWGLLPASGTLEVSVPARRRRPGIVVHRRSGLARWELTQRHGIPVTAPISTLIDIAPRLERRQIEAAINEADKLGLTTPEKLRHALDSVASRPGLAALRAALDRHTFTLTDSDLERRFLPLVREAGLPLPDTGRRVNGFKVDFYWPDLGLIVETDGLRYHRTAAQQASDRLRDQKHAAAGLTPLRFTNAQVRFEPGHVLNTLAAVARRLEGGSRTAGNGR